MGGDVIGEGTFGNKLVGGGEADSQHFQVTGKVEIGSTADCKFEHEKRKYKTEGEIELQHGREKWAGSKDILHLDSHS